MNSLTLRIPRVIFSKFNSDPIQLVDGIRTILENINLTSLTRQLLYDYSFNNKSFTKKIVVEITFIPKVVHKLHVCSREINIDISAIASFVIDLYLHMRDPEYFGVGYKFKRMANLLELQKSVFRKDDAADPNINPIAVTDEETTIQEEVEKSKPKSRKISAKS